MNAAERERLWPILYWGPAIARSAPEHGMTMLAELAVALLTGIPANPQPRNCIRTDISTKDRADLAKLLAAGETVEAYFGWANCRICGVQLGTKDLHGFGFIWPEKSEHYILEHSVWTPGCSRLLERSRKN